MTATIDYSAINAKAEQARDMIDEVHQAADKAWQGALRAVAELAVMYGIDPAKVRVVNTNEGYGYVRLAVSGEDGYATYSLHEDKKLAEQFATDANSLLDDSLFYGFFERDADVEDSNTVRLV